MLAVTGPLPIGPGWVYEFKWDGVRAIAVLAGGAVRLYARSGAEITTAYPELVETAAVPVGAVLDGEVGPPVYGADAERLAGIAERLEQRLGTSALAAARRRGQAMTAAEALDFAQAETERIQTLATQTE